jgi:hypothetical protein
MVHNSDFIHPEEVDYEHEALIPACKCGASEFWLEIECLEDADGWIECEYCAARLDPVKFA